MSSRKKKIVSRGDDRVLWLEPLLLKPNLALIRTGHDNIKQHGRVLFACDNDFGPFARIELLSWDTGEKLSEVLFDRSMLLECEFFDDDTADRWLELVKAIRADFKARKKTEASA